MFDAFTVPFVQRGMWEVLLLAVAAGLIGTWVVLRGLAFFAHAVGTATFPGLVVADGVGFPAALGGAGTGLLVAGGVGAATRGEGGRDRYDSATALVLVGALALGVILASDVFDSSASVETLLFGSLLLIDTGDILLAGVVSALVLAATLVVGDRWLAAGFDPSNARALGVRSALPDALLLLLVALTAVAALSAVGALLATALIVVPAATTRLLFRRLRRWQVATVILVALEGVAGLWLSVETNAPPGATVAVLSGGVFVAAALWRGLRPRRPRGRAVAAAATAVVAGLLAAGCGDDDGGGAGGDGDAALTVVATTTQLGDFAREVGGDRVEVVQLLQANSDPHDYEPRPDDVRRAAEADVMLASGRGLDGWASEVADQAGIEDAVVDVGEDLPVAVEGGDDHADEHPGEEGGEHAEEEDEAHAGEGDVDPHWWHDPRNARAAVATIASSFAEADAGGASAYRTAAERYDAELAALDEQLGSCFAAVPAEDRKLVSDHDAFGYLTNRYDIEFIGAIIPATTTQAQPSAGELSELVRTVREEGVRAIFPESSLNPDLAETIADRTGAVVGGALYSDTLGPEGTDAGTYLGSMRANAEALVRGFTGGERGCTAGG